MEIAVRDNARYEVGGEFLHALQVAVGFKQGALAPNLRVFAWPTPRSLAGLNNNPQAIQRLYPYMSLFLGERVEELGETDFSYNPRSTASVYSIAMQLPNLKKLDIVEVEDGFAPDFFPSFPWANLETLSVTLKTTSGLAIVYHAASLPRLKKLSIIDEKGILCMCRPAEMPDVEGGVLFSSLRELNIATDDIPSLNSLVNCIPIANVIQLLSLSTQDIGGFKETQAFLELLSERLNPTHFLSLSLSDNGKDESIPHQTDSQDLELHPIDEFNISPLFAFTKLVRLELNLTTPVRVSPEDVAAMASAWTQLVALDVLPVQTCYGRLPLINHAHVLNLLRACTHLRYLGLRFDTTQIGEDEKTKKYKNLGCLLVGESPICSPSRVAKFIRRTLPKLQELYVEYDECAWKTSIQRKRWAAVRKELGLAISPENEESQRESQRTADLLEIQFPQGSQYSQVTDESQTTEESEDSEED